MTLFSLSCITQTKDTIPQQHRLLSRFYTPDFLPQPSSSVARGSLEVTLTVSTFDPVALAIVTFFTSDYTPAYHCPAWRHLQGLIRQNYLNTSLSFDESILFFTFLNQPDSPSIDSNRHAPSSQFGNSRLLCSLYFSLDKSTFWHVMLCTTICFLYIYVMFKRSKYMHSSS